MPLPLEQFVKQLEDSGIIASETLKDFIPPKANPKNAEELARELVVKKKLTKFQANEAYQGKAKNLRLGNYTILDKIGAGGMGQVFKAEHRRMKRIVAIKMLPPAVTKDAAAVARFQREVEAAAKLRHTNIVAADDADEARGVHFLVMEYVAGRDLSALVKKDGPFPVDKAVNYVLQAARGLEFAHKNGVIHRDIKPANLLLGSDGTVKILDMGLARIEAVGDADTQAELTGTGMVMGTVDYMAPEQGMNTKNADARADIYSLGCTLHYLLIGKAVYRGETVMAKMVAHLQELIPNLCQLRNEVPLQVDTVFQKMVAKKIEDRYQTMTEVLADLERCGVGREASSSGIHSIGLDNDEGLLTFLRDIPVQTTHKPRAAKAAGQGGWSNKKPLVIGAGVLGVIGLLLGVVISLRTKDGTLVVEVNQPDAVVQVLSEEGKVEISEPGGLKPISISVVPGKHRIRVEKDGFVAIATDFEIQSGESLPLKARLVPKATTVAAQPNKSWETPALQAWMKTAAALPAEKQVEAVSKKLMELNRGFDGKVTPKIDKGVVTGLHFLSDNVTDISAVRALPGLKELNCSGSRTTGGSSNGKLSDLSPLQGMKLTRLECYDTPVSDLSPLQGMPLAYVICNQTQVSDLSPLRGMPLTYVLIGSTLVSDLSPLQGMPLTILRLNHTQVSDLSPLKGMKLAIINCGVTPLSDLSPLRGMPLTELLCSGTKVVDILPLEDCKGLKTLQATKTKITPAQVAALQKALPNCKIEWDDPAKASAKKLAYLDPAFQQWAKATQALPAERQVEAVAKKLQELNPGFDGQVTPKFEGRVVTELQFHTDNVTDIAPVRVLTGLKSLTIRGTDAGGGRGASGTLQSLSQLAGMQLTFLNCEGNARLADLSPLIGMKLTSLFCGTTDVSDLSPIQGMPLTTLGLTGNKVSDLSPLKGMHLKSLVVHYTKVSDLSPLRGMPLAYLNCLYTLVSDLSPLQGMPLTFLWCSNTSVSTLSPLQGMPLTTLWCYNTPVADLSPLQDCKNLTSLNVKATKVTPVQVAALQKALPNCKIEWGDPATSAPAKLAYLDPAFQQWVKATQALPAEKQIEAVSKKLMELNAGFDGKVTGWNGTVTPTIEEGVVTGFGFITDNVMDISPVRALAGMKGLACSGSARGAGTLADLSPLLGLKLQYLLVNFTEVVNLEPLHGMPLTSLFFDGSSVSDLSPLREMRLTSLRCSGTKIVDLSPLRGMSLTNLVAHNTRIFDLSPLDTCKTLKALNVHQTKVTAASVTALQKALPNCKIDWDGAATPAKLAYLDPAFQQWVKATQALPAEQQIEAVSKKLMELNPGFDGKVNDSFLSGTPKIEERAVTDFAFVSDNVTDISPVRALVGVRVLSCGGSQPGKGKLSDLSPLVGVKLTSLTFAHTSVSDLSPLRAIPLHYLNCSDTPVADLSSLQERKLTALYCTTTNVSDLSSLTNMQTLRFLGVQGTKVPPAQVAALQKALPNCKIEWDEPSKPKRPEPATAGKK